MLEVLLYKTAKKTYIFYEMLQLYIWVFALDLFLLTPHILKT